MHSDIECAFPTATDRKSSYVLCFANVYWPVVQNALRLQCGCARKSARAACRSQHHVILRRVCTACNNGSWGETDCWHALSCAWPSVPCTACVLATALLSLAEQVARRRGCCPSEAMQLCCSSTGVLQGFCTDSANSGQVAFLLLLMTSMFTRCCCRTWNVSGWLFALNSTQCCAVKLRVCQYLGTVGC